MERKSVIVLILVLFFATLTGYVELGATEVYPPLLCLLGFSFVAGFLQQKGAWRWALIIGLSLPFSHFIADAVNLKVVDPPRFPITLVVLVIPALVATYGGVLFNRLLRSARDTETM